MKPKVRSWAPKFVMLEENQGSRWIKGRSTVWDRTGKEMKEIYNFLFHHSYSYCITYRKVKAQTKISVYIDFFVRLSIRTKYFSGKV